jgi:hypothetical protein
MTELKLRFDDPNAGPLRLFESLEALSLGIEGKRSLWIALTAAAENTPALPSLVYGRRVWQRRNRRHQAAVTGAVDHSAGQNEEARRAAMK